MSNRKHLAHSASHPIRVGDIFIGSDRQGHFQVERIDDCHCVFHGAETHLNILCRRVNEHDFQPTRDGVYFFIGYRYCEGGLFLTNMAGNPAVQGSQIFIIARNLPDSPEPAEVNADPAEAVHVNAYVPPEEIPYRENSRLHVWETLLMTTQEERCHE